MTDPELIYLRDLKSICERIRTSMIGMNNAGVGEHLNSMQSHLRILSGENAQTFEEYVERKEKLLL